MNSQVLRDELQSLYNELKEELKGKYTGKGVYIPPTATSFFLKAEALVNKAVEYSNVDESFMAAHILHTLDKEVAYVKDYRGKSKSQKKNQEELESMMRKAVHQLYIDLSTIVSE